MNNELLPFPLDKLGFDARYILFPLPNCYLYDKVKKAVVEPIKEKGKPTHNYNLRRADGTTCKRALKTLYRLCFNEEYCIDNIPNLPNEKWLPMIEPNRPEIDTSGYLVSNQKGRIKSYKGYNAIILEQQTNNKGYKYVTIDGKNLRVHRLVAFAFRPNDEPDRKTTVDHKDGNKANNDASNLQWMTLLDNILKGGTKQDTEVNSPAI